MKPLIPVKFIIPLGLLLLSASFILKQFFVLPDFADGFLKGAGIGIILIAFIKQWYVKQSNS
ncbi:hypothetical protein [Mucilaginibacter sp. OK098]|uniref:hypothetical protein n=1 Tax=Mucilaginibacter sp. OK098 TaxID=1855297 RepID=UPI00091C10E9|nr:hypothetical protein [Mucilaginibacter sp. OK098]SHN11620.1 hypothetical protein SAMN05216524_105340 [Mucilaginibacter sp. OK098]